MHLRDHARWVHEHRFDNDVPVEGERRTHWVIALTAVMMAVEIAAGMALGSMALLADGWHMASHAAALGVAAFAYSYARRHAHDRRYTFGTGKVGAVGGFASAVGLAVVAVMLLGESVLRFAAPVRIRFDEALLVAGVGLVVNLVSAVLLRHDHTHEHHGHEHHDHNLRGAYLHVLADALTSVLALVALTVAKLFDWTWADPAMGIVGALLIARWSYGLVRDSGAVLLDAEVGEGRTAAMRSAIESDGDTTVTDLHVWRVGPRHLAAIVSVVSHERRDPDDYKQRLARFEDLVHVTVEVQQCCEALER